jgi:hypothetical protein
MAAVGCQIPSDVAVSLQMEGSDTSACLAQQSSNSVHVNMIETIGKATGKATKTPMPTPSQGYGEAAQQAPLYNTRVRHVRFCLELNSTHEVTAYSEVYGLHPHDFNFEKYVHPQAWCFVAPCDTESDSENDFEEEEEEDVEDEQPFILRWRPNMALHAAVDEQEDQRDNQSQAPPSPVSSADYRHEEATHHGTVAIKLASPIIAHSPLGFEERLSNDDEKAFKTEALFPAHSISRELIRETLSMLGGLAPSSPPSVADDALVSFSPHSTRASNPTLLGFPWPRTAAEKPGAVRSNGADRNGRGYIAFVDN